MEGAEVVNKSIEINPQWITYNCLNRTYFLNGEKELTIICDGESKHWAQEENHTNIYGVRVSTYHTVIQEDLYCVDMKGKGINNGLRCQE